MLIMMNILVVRRYLMGYCDGYMRVGSGLCIAAKPVVDKRTVEVQHDASNQEKMEPDR